MSKAVIRRSIRIYNFLLKLYPKRYRQEFGEEMLFVYSESLKDIYAKKGERGIFSFWIRTLFDVVKSLFVQHIEKEKGGEDMKTRKTDIIMQNNIFTWIALATVLILLVPFALTIRDGGVKGVGWNWTFPGDYIFGFIMIFGFSSLYIMAARKWKKSRVMLAIAVAALFLYIWAEFAVGIFTNMGS